MEPLSNLEPIPNRVAESDIDVFDLESLWDGGEVVEFDLAPFLYRGLVLREKEFRQAVKAHDWAAYRDRHVAVFCSTDAIIPTWAPMLVASKLTGLARSVAAGRAADLRRDHYARALAAFDWSRFAHRIVVIKGCGAQHVPPNAYLVATQQLQRVARKLMYGEPCSSVPLWRKPAEGPATQPAPARAARPVALPKPEGRRPGRHGESGPTGPSV